MRKYYLTIQEESGKNNSRRRIVNGRRNTHQFPITITWQSIKIIIITWYQQIRILNKEMSCFDVANSQITKFIDWKCITWRMNVQQKNKTRRKIMSMNILFNNARFFMSYVHNNTRRSIMRITYKQYPFQLRRNVWRRKSLLILWMNEHERINIITKIQVTSKGSEESGYLAMNQYESEWLPLSFV